MVKICWKAWLLRPQPRSRSLTSAARASFVAVTGRDFTTNHLLWIGPQPGGGASGPLTITAGRDILFGAASQIHVSNGQTLTFTANRNLTMYLLETLGAVNLTATTGNITLNNDIGPHITNGTTWPDFNPTDKGVASLHMTAGGSITMQGARAEGNVVITAGSSLTAAKAITSVGGTVTLITGVPPTLNQAVPIGTQNQVDYPLPVSPVAPPGPKSPLPTGPGSASNGGPGLPAFAEIPVSAADQLVGGVIAPGAAGGGFGLPGGAAGVGAPGGTTGLSGRPGFASGSNPGVASGSNNPGTADTAAALRTAGEACGEETSSTEKSGLADLTPGEAQASDQKNASCPPAAETTGQAAAGAPGGTTAPGATAPGQTPATTTASPIGGGLQ